jgi:hypothetical protein
MQIVSTSLPTPARNDAGPGKCYNHAMPRLFVASLLLAFFAGCSRQVSSHIPESPSAYDANGFIAYIHNGMPKDSVESVAGEPVLIVDGIPVLEADSHDQRRGIVVAKRSYDRYETWFFGPSKIDTIRSVRPVVLYSSDYDDFPQNQRTAELKYSFAVVFNKDTHEVVKKGFFPRGFVDQDKDIELGAIVVPSRRAGRLPHS